MSNSSSNQYAFFVDEPHSTLYPFWSKEEQSNPKLAKARLLVELGLTETHPTLLTALWRQALELGFSVDALKSLTLLANHRVAAQSWLSEFQWGFESQDNPFVPEIPSELDKLLYNKKALSHPDIEGLEKEILTKDIDQVLSVLLEHGFWSNPDWTLFIPDLWNQKEEGMPWWIAALATNAHKCAELAYPDIVKNATQKQLDTALMVVFLGQMNFLKKEIPPRGCVWDEASIAQPMSSLNAVKWAKRLIELGANPYQFFEIDGYFDEMLYSDVSTDIAPRNTGKTYQKNTYCVAHILLYLMVHADRYTELKPLVDEFVPVLEASKIPLDAWGRDPASIVLLASQNIFYKNSTSSTSSTSLTYQGETAIDWLKNNLEQWGDSSSSEYGWNPALSLWLLALKKEYARSMILENKFFEKIKMYPVSWNMLKVELNTHFFDQWIKATTLGMDTRFKLESWGFDEQGVLEAITPKLEESLKKPWMTLIESSRHYLKDLLALKSQEKGIPLNNKSLLFVNGNLEEYPNLDMESVLSAYRLNWDCFKKAEDPSLVFSNSKSKLRL